jgi:RNA polymerase sigma-70 factor (ECF subfamily)
MAAVSLHPEQLSDWLARGALGEEAACAALFQHFSPFVMRLCVGLLGNLEDAEEVTQDTFVYALSRLGRYDPSRSAFSTWLYTIAVSRCRNKRRRKVLASLPLEFLADQRFGRPDRLLEQMLERRGVREQVWRALQAMPAHLREAVALRYLAEMRYKDIGRALECNPKTAESRVRLGLAAMRAALSAGGVEPAADPGEQWAL